MAKPGRKPKPTPLKLANGTRKDRINPSEPPKLDGDPEPPVYLDAVARAEWDRMITILRRLGILSAAHGSALGLYCQQFARLVAAEAQVAAEGLTVTSDRGAVSVNPHVRIARDSALFCARMLTEFGLSPSSSSRITTKAPEDELETFLGHG